MQRLSGKEKLKIVEEYMNTNRSLQEVSIRNAISFDTLKLWVRYYRLHGKDAFIKEDIKKRKFTKEFKIAICDEYRETGCSLNAISIKYVLDPSTVRVWLKKYDILKASLIEENTEDSSSEV